jgi:hypothetical protein
LLEIAGALRRSGAAACSGPALPASLAEPGNPPALLRRRPAIGWRGPSLPEDAE